MSNVISVFTGMGGLDLGLEKAGFNIKACVEIDTHSRKTIQKNRPDWNLTENGDIFRCSSEEILKTANIRKDDVCVLAGGPPCQPYSKSSNWSGVGMRGIKDPRAKTVYRYIELIDSLTPQVLLMENVRGFITNRNNSGFQILERAIEQINDTQGTNYKLNVFFVDAADYGVPQHRQRIFIIAHRDGLDFSFPRPTHGPNSPSHRPYTSCAQAFSSIIENKVDGLIPTGKWANLLPTIPPGENYSWHTDKKGGVPLFGWRTKFWNFLLKLSPNLPSWTIQASPGPSTGPFHWENRKISIHEALCIQSIPPWALPYGNYRESIKQIGNAVPSVLSEIIGLEIRRQFFGIRTRRFSRLLPNYPHDFSIQSAYSENIPHEYQKLIGEHMAHPGTGKGPAYTNKKVA